MITEWQPENARLLQAKNLITQNAALIVYAVMVLLVSELCIIMSPDKFNLDPRYHLHFYFTRVLLMLSVKEYYHAIIDPTT
jgi:hypothetical protein